MQYDGSRDDNAVNTTFNKKTISDSQEDSPIRE